MILISKSGLVGPVGCIRTKDMNSLGPDGWKAISFDWAKTLSLLVCFDMTGNGCIW